MLRLQSESNLSQNAEKQYSMKLTNESTYQDDMKIPTNKYTSQRYISQMNCNQNDSYHRSTMNQELAPVSFNTKYACHTRGTKKRKKKRRAETDNDQEKNVQKPDAKKFRDEDEASSFPIGVGVKESSRYENIENTASWEDELGLTAANRRLR